MGSFISETSNYLFAIIIILYIISNVLVFSFKNKNVHNRFYFMQSILAVSFHAVGYITLFVRSEDLRYFFFFAFQEIIILAIILLYNTLYPTLSRLLLNNMIFFLYIGFVILGRLAFDNAVRQFVITVAMLIISLFIPWFFRKIRIWNKLTYLYCGVGIALLALVWLTGQTTYGSKLAFRIFGMSFQPSEFVKVSIVFYLAAALSNKEDNLRYLTTGLFSAAHIVILVFSKDLGSAGIYFVTYIFMVYFASEKFWVVLAGGFSGIGGFALAYKFFAHVRNRVKVWINPWSDIENSGYQLTQSLFAIGTGGWFGMGLLNGTPESIPLVNEDFIFSAIGEEMGVVVAACICALYLMTILHMFRMAMQVKTLFYKLILSGFAVCLATQIFLTIGGGTRLIPLTGVTLPLMSMGGSSLCATILMFSIIQGIYVDEFRGETEPDEDEYDDSEGFYDDAVETSGESDLPTDEDDEFDSVQIESDELPDDDVDELPDDDIDELSEEGINESHEEDIDELPEDETEEFYEEEIDELSVKDYEEEPLKEFEEAQVNEFEEVPVKELEESFEEYEP